MSEPERGAYGLRLPTLPGQHWLGAALPEWPSWTLRQADPDAQPSEEWLSGDGARIRLTPAGFVDIDRRSRTSTVRAPDPVPDDAWVHPVLASTAIIAAEWAGRLVFHGGAFAAADGSVWAVLGGRTNGKSTTMAWMSAHGHPVVADDLVVTDGEQVFAGPRCIDLRRETAQRFELGRDVGMLGSRRRWRVDLPPAAPSAPLGGFVVLEWADDVNLERVPVQRRGNVLQPHVGLRVGQRHAMPWLRVLARPTLVVQRPRDWKHLDRSLSSVLTATQGAAHTVPQ